jgi:pimeloyl-ACP methyl ester carboxylesterase
MTASIFEQGSGAPLVLIPGLQGRWEYMRPAVDALSQHFRVLTFSLRGERETGLPVDHERGLDNYVAQVGRVLEEKRVDRAIVCGVSFGGVVAARFASTQPARTAKLILVSTPGPAWHLKPRHRFYLRAPLLFGPLFMAEAPWRMRKELATALPRRRDRARFAVAQLKTLGQARVSFARMAERARSISTLDLADDCARIVAPTLVVTGEAGLDHVVPREGASAYIRAISGARGAVIERTGHLGVITRPDAFASLVRAFVEGQLNAAA